MGKRNFCDKNKKLAFPFFREEIEKKTFSDKKKLFEHLGILVCDWFLLPIPEQRLYSFLLKNTQTTKVIDWKSFDSKNGISFILSVYIIYQ